MGFISKFFIAAALGIASLFGWHQAPSNSQNFGSFTPVGGQTYTLSGAGVTASANTITLTSFTTPAGTPITMSMIGSTGYGTLEPNTSSKIENITFTGVTQNANGTAVLTGVTRGIDFVSPYGASTTLQKSHSGGAYFILSNTAGFYGQQFLFANNTGTSTATLVFSSTTPPRYDLDLSSWSTADSRTFADKAYVDSVAIAGAPNGNTSTNGIYQEATGAQAAATTGTGSTGADLVLSSRISTSSCQVAGNYILVASSTNGKLDGNCFNTGYMYTFTQPETFSATTTFATTTAASSTITTLNAGTIHATTLTGNGSGITSLTIPRYAFASTTQIRAGNVAVTSATTTVPANTLSASSTIDIFGFFNCTTSASDTCTISLSDNNTTLTGTNCSISTNQTGEFHIRVIFTGSASQTNICDMFGSSLAYAGGNSSINASDSHAFSINILGAGASTLTLYEYEISINP